MSITLTADAGSATANAFITLAEAAAYAETRSNASAWSQSPSGAETITQQQAIISATRQLSAMGWQGSRSTNTQALSWPRTWVVDYDAPVGVTYIGTTVVPAWLKDATSELAIEIVKAGSSDILALPSTEGVIQKVVGPLSTTYADPYAQKQGVQRYPMVWALIRRYVVGVGGISTPTVRG